jgi:peptidoglycan/LPS O-acetylase OafA/YrhL
MKPNWHLLAGMRFFLATVVMFSHTKYNLEWDYLASIGTYFGAFTAVLSFMLISGYSIAHSISVQPKGFYMRRFARLAPTYYLCLLLAVVTYGLFSYFTEPGAVERPKTTGDLLSWASAIFMLGGVVSLGPPLIQPAWTLGAEICYYAVAPLLLRLRRLHMVAVAAVSVLLYLYIGAQWGNAFSLWPGAMTIISLFWAWLAGWLLYRHRENPLCWVGLVAVLGLAGGAPDSFANGNLLIMSATGAVLILGHMVELSHKARRVSAYLGELSFPLYLCHIPAFHLSHFLAHKGILPNNGLVSVLFAFFCAIFVARMVRVCDLAWRRLEQRARAEVPMPVQQLTSH